MVGSRKITFQCDHCQTRLKGQETLAGTTVVCPKCQKKVVVMALTCDIKKGEESPHGPVLSEVRTTADATIEALLSWYHGWKALRIVCYVLGVAAILALAANPLSFLHFCCWSIMFCGWELLALTKLTHRLNMHRFK